MTSWEPPGPAEPQAIETPATTVETPAATVAPPIEPAVPPTRPAWRDWRPPGSGSVDAVRYGPDIPTEADLKLLGHVEGKRVVELGCGTGHNAIALARQGARVIGVDPSAEDLAIARRRCEEAEVRVELHHADPAELAFLRADTVDAALSTWAVARVPDVSRVFRQVHRVLRPEAPLVLSLPHPAFSMVVDEAGTPTIRRSYFDRAPLEESVLGAVQHHTLADLFMALVRANFRVDVVAEPEPPAGGPRGVGWSEAARLVPRTLVVRARKEGS